MTNQSRNVLDRAPATAPITKHRKKVNDAMLDENDMLLVGIGQCSMNADHLDITRREAESNLKLMRTIPSSLIMQRQNYWKPHTPRTDGTTPWEGMETTHPAEAITFFQESLEKEILICSEVALCEHIGKYASGLTLGWVGARNRDDSFVRNLATAESDMPLAIKNDLDGSLDWALDTTTNCTELRENSDRPGAVVLLHRGGDNLNTPEKWEKSVISAIQRTGGRMILDLAHGAEQAHDPNGNYQKSANAQARALEHYIAIGERTGLWVKGLLIEASDAPSATDPNMPRQLAIDGLMHIRSQMVK